MRLIAATVIRATLLASFACAKHAATATTMQRIPRRQGKFPGQHPPGAVRWLNINGLTRSGECAGSGIGRRKTRPAAEWQRNLPSPAWLLNSARDVAFLLTKSHP
jgi:hypothetical protein